MRRPRVAIVATGSELVRGDRHDRNGPFLAHAVLSLGLDPARITIVGDAPDDLEAALRDGLPGRSLRRVRGPGADARRPHGGDGRAGRRRRARRRRGPRGRDRGRLAVVRGAPRQAVRRLRARRAEAGDAPRGRGLDRPRRNGAGLRAAEPSARSWSCCPAHRASSSGCGRPRWRPQPVRDVLERARHRERRTLRLYGVSESSVARTLHEAGGDGDGVDVTVCARDFEIHVDALAEPGAESRAEALFGALRAEHERHVFAEDERPVRGDRARPLPGARLDARHRRVLHRRSRGRAADERVGARATSSSAASSRTPMPSRRSSSASPAISCASTEPSRRRRRRRWLAVPASGSARTSASPSPVSRDRAAGHRRSPLASSIVHADAPDASRGVGLQLPGRSRVDSPSRRGRGAPSRPTSLVTEPARIRVTSRRYGGGSWTSAHLLWPHASGRRARRDRRVAARFPPR